MNIEQTECSGTLAYHILTPGIYPEEIYNIQNMAKVLNQVPTLLHKKDTQNEQRLIPGRERFLPHYVQGISWSIHFCTLWVLWIISWVGGRVGWTVWTKHTAIPQLSSYTAYEQLYPIQYQQKYNCTVYTQSTKTVQLNLSTSDSQTHCN